MKPTRTAVQSVVLALLAALLAAACLPPVPNGPPRTAAFWYLRYPQTPTGHYTPLLQPYNSSLPKVLKQEVNEMQYAGIQIGIISWFGPGTQSEATRLPLALRAADGTHFRETLYYEPEGHGNPTSAKIESDLAYIEAHYSHSRNWLRIGGKPVLFVWGDGGDNCSTLARWAAAPRTAHFWIVQKVFPGYTTCGTNRRTGTSTAPRRTPSPRASTATRSARGSGSTPSPRPGWRGAWPAGPPTSRR